MGICKTFMLLEASYNMVAGGEAVRCENSGSGPAGRLVRGSGLTLRLRRVCYGPMVD